MLFFACFDGLFLFRETKVNKHVKVVTLCAHVVALWFYRAKICSWCLAIKRVQCRFVGSTSLTLVVVSNVEVRPMDCAWPVTDVIQLKNTLGRSAVVSCEGQLIVLCGVECCVLLLWKENLRNGDDRKVRSIGQLKCDGTRAETRFRLSAKRTSPFKSVGASVQSTTGSRGVRISGNNAGYTIFQGSVRGIGYPLHSAVSPSLALPYVTVCHHISTGIHIFDRIDFCARFAWR
jgi:hypothetical protein